MIGGFSWLNLLSCVILFRRSESAIHSPKHRFHGETFGGWIILLLIWILIDTMTCRHCVARGTFCNENDIWGKSMFTQNSNVEYEYDVSDNNNKNISENFFSRLLCYVLRIDDKIYSWEIMSDYYHSNSTFITDKWPMIFSDLCTAYAFYASHMVMKIRTLRADRQGILASILCQHIRKTLSMKRNLEISKIKTIRWAQNVRSFLQKLYR